MLEIRHLVKHFGPLMAVDDVSFTVPRGEVLGFLGPNGAGKSTTMKMITGFLAPTAGTAIICGHDIATEPIAAKKHIGYLPEGAPAYPDMTPADFLDFIAHIRGFSRRRGKAPHRPRRRDDQDRRGPAPADRNLVEGLSNAVSGWRRRLLHDPEVLILDEPTDGLDPNQKYEMREIIGAMRPEKAIIISTHLLEEVEAVCSRAIIIAHGRILADGTPAELAAALAPSQRRAPRHGRRQPTASIGAELAALPGVAAVEPVSDSEGDALMRVPAGGRPVVAEIADLARDRGWTVTGLRVERGRLDDVFREITQPSPSRPAIAAAA